MKCTASPPDKRFLDLYVDLVMQGKSDDEICKEFGMSKKAYDKNQSFFLFHFKEEMKKRTREGLVNGSLPDVPLTIDRRRKFLELIRSGVSIQNIATIMGVNLPIVNEVWLKDPDFNIEVRFARELLTAKIERALVKRAMGFIHPSETVTVTKTKGQTNEGIPIDRTVTSTTTRERIVYPSVDAIKFFLINRSPERYSPDGGVNTANKGTILDAIEDLAKFTPEEIEEIEEETF